MTDWSEATDPVQPVREREERLKSKRSAETRDRISKALRDGPNRQKYLERLRRQGGAKWAARPSTVPSFIDAEFDEEA